MAIGHGELMHECFPKHSRMRTVRINEIRKEADEDGKKRGVSIEIFFFLMRCFFTATSGTKPT